MAKGIAKGILQDMIPTGQRHRGIRITNDTSMTVRIAACTNQFWSCKALAPGETWGSAVDLERSQKEADAEYLFYAESSLGHKWEGEATGWMSRAVPKGRPGYMKYGIGDPQYGLDRHFVTAIAERYQYGEGSVAHYYHYERVGAFQVFAPYPVCVSLHLSPNGATSFTAEKEDGTKMFTGNW